VAETLAIDGGTPVRTAPMPPWPLFADEDIEAVSRVLRSGKVNYWTGEECRTFEREHAAITGRTHAISLANGTLALELALRAFRVGPGDEVVVPARTFIATAGSVVAVGATPVIADVDPGSGNLTATTLATALSERTKAVIPVHLGGWPVDMDPVMALAETHGLVVIEDCAQAHGAAYRGRPVGSLGHAAAFSFCQDKIVPLGEGGMLVLDDDDAYERAWAYKDHGKSLRKVLETQGGSPTAFKWLVDTWGSNFRMTEITAAMGRVGLARLPEWHARRTRHATRLAAGLADVAGLQVPLPPEGLEHAFYRLYASIEPSALKPGWNRDRVLDAIAAEGVPVQYGTCAEIYREPAFAASGLGPAERLPGAARAHETSLAFFVHPTLEDEDIDDTVAAVRKVMGVAAA
jgi:dTDP-4-amino-4,6-dideoxygalactose transaminase